MGPEERRLIRSHVMKGKNAGRPRPTRKKQRTGTGTLPTRRILTRYSDPPPERSVSHYASCEAHDCRHALELKQLFWDDLALTPFPQQLSPESRSLLQQCKSMSAPKDAHYRQAF